MKPKTNVIALVAQKGGAGKTTLAVHLAVSAGDETAIIDTDPQASAWQWHASRDGIAFPLAAKATASTLPRIIAEGRDSGFRSIIIDTPPHTAVVQAAAVEACDFALIPVRPTVLDLRAIAPTIATVQKEKKRAGIVLSACPPKGIYESARVAEAREICAAYNVAVYPGQISQRNAYADALINGRAVTEFEPSGKAAAEMRQLWAWIEGHF